MQGIGLKMMYSIKIYCFIMAGHLEICPKVCVVVFLVCVFVWECVGVQRVNAGELCVRVCVLKQC